MTLQSSFCYYFEMKFARIFIFLILVLNNSKNIHLCRIKKYFVADTDERLWLASLRKGEQTALRKIFDRHYPLLLGDIYRIIPDQDTCQDLAQEVFVELWRKRDVLDIQISLRAYLRKAAVNRALNYIKVNKKVLLDNFETHPESAGAEWQEMPALEEKKDMEAALHQAIENLPERCRLVFSLSRFENLSHKEIAEKLDISVKTIENQITKAMKLLREALLVFIVLSPVGIWLLKIFQ